MATSQEKSHGHHKKKKHKHKHRHHSNKEESPPPPLDKLLATIARVDVHSDDNTTGTDAATGQTSSEQIEENDNEKVEPATNKLHPSDEDQGSDHSENEDKSTKKSNKKRKHSKSQHSKRRHHRSRSRGSRQHSNGSRSGSRHRSRSRDRYHSRKSRHSRSRDCSRTQRRYRRSRSREWIPTRRYQRRSSSSSSEKSLPFNIATLYPIYKTKADTIAEFTAFCRTLSQTQDATVEVNHPFKVADNEDTVPTINNIVTPNEVVMESNEHDEQDAGTIDEVPIPVVMETGIDTRPLEMKFPVSSGLHHMDESVETPNESISLSEVLVQRALASQRLQLDSADVEAQLQLQELDEKIKHWCQGQTTPGKYTGYIEITPMDKATHSKGPQAWAKKKMFHSLTPVMSGFGMRMLMKMGWELGQPLGKSGQGHLVPIPLDVKTDRQGLSTDQDKPNLSSGSTLPSNEATPACLQGKHPVSALQELCTKKQWDPPTYEVVSETGPPHMKAFLYRVKIQPGIFQPSCSSNNKKIAKAQAALAALKSLGLT